MVGSLCSWHGHVIVACDMLLARRFGNKTSMGKNLQVQADATLTFAHYLSWADLLNRMFEAEMAQEPNPADSQARRDHEWRWFGLMCYWYSSLHVVVEAWDALGFSDPVIDRLLAHPRGFKQLLRHHRNAVFHYQRSLLSPKLFDLLANGAAQVHWIRALHGEFLRFLADTLVTRMVTLAQQAELRETIESDLHWYPSRETPIIESLARTIASGRELLGRHPDDHSDERREIERTLEFAEATLREGRKSWAALRRQVLREAGVE